MSNNVPMKHRVMAAIIRAAHERNLYARAVVRDVLRDIADAYADANGLSREQFWHFVGIDR